MRRCLILMIALCCSPLTAQNQAPASVPLGGAGRPETPGITRTQLRDDPKSAAVRVVFEPGAKEPPHTHPYDVILVPLTNSPVELTIGNETIKTFSPGTVHFVPREVVHSLANGSTTQKMELVTVAIK